MHLIEFGFSNFKSYKDEAIISFEALDSDFMSDNVFKITLNCGETLSLLKSAVIYGANAAGKSNVIWALRAFSFFIRKSRDFASGDQIYFEPFLFENNDSPINLWMLFVINGVKFKYSFSYTKEAFIKEQLYMFDKGKRLLIFSRSHKRFFKFESHGLNIPTSLKNEKPLPNHLFLSEIASEKKNDLQPIYEALSSIDSYPILNNCYVRNSKPISLAARVGSQDSKLFKRLETMVELSDLGIKGLNLKRHDDSEFNFPSSISKQRKEDFIENNRWEFLTLHRTKDGRTISINIENESTGTQNVIYLGSNILEVLENGGVFALDEMDLALHQTLLCELVSLFHNPETNPLNAQLLFTAHNTSIISEFEGIMRTDQIWFAEKDEYGESSLFNAKEFEGVGISVPFERWYRLGRFGAIPRKGDFTLIFKN